MNLQAIRGLSLEFVKKIGYPFNPSLPLLEISIKARSVDEVEDRSLSLVAILACAFGFNRKDAISWLNSEKLFESLTESEKDFISGNQTNLESLKLQIEALWGLSWVLGLIRNLNFSEYCEDNLVTIFPNLNEKESSINFRKKIRLRSDEEIIVACDLAYCLHWAIEHLRLNSISISKPVDDYVIIERRKALEWVLSDYSWDELPMDT